MWIFVSARVGLMLCVLGLHSIWLGNSYAAESSKEEKTSEIDSLELAKATGLYRLDLIKLRPEAPLTSLFRAISGDAALAKSLDRKQIVELGSVFMSGAIPYVFPKSTVMFYNHFCDIALVIQADPISGKQIKVIGSFALGGDTLASYFGVQEPLIGPDNLGFVAKNFKERVASRVDLVSRYIRDHSASDLYSDTKSKENYSKLFSRLLLLISAQSNFTKQEIVAIHEITKAFDSNTVPALSNNEVISIAPALASAFQERTGVLGNYKLVFSFGTPIERTFLISPTNTPMLLIWIDTTTVSGKVRIKKMEAENLSPPSNS